MSRDMTPGVYNITLYRGSTFPLVGIQFIGGSGPFDLTGFTAKSEVRVQSGESVILDLQPEVSDAASGTITIPSLTDEQTLALPAGVYHWDLLLLDVFNEVFGPFLTGQFYILDKITAS